MIRTASAQWQGNLKEGTGTVSSQSGVLDKTNYSFKTRFEEGIKGTNPEELLAAAHAGCFTMAVASELDKEGLSAGSLDTKATLTLEGLSVTAIHLSITGKVNGLNANEFEVIVKDSEKNCIISKALKVAITSESHFIA